MVAGAGVFVNHFAVVLRGVNTSVKAGRTLVDGKRIDGIARKLAAGTDRRRAVQMVGAGLLAAWWSERRRLGAAAQSDEGSSACTDDDDCRGSPVNPCYGATCVGGRCLGYVADCQAGYACCGQGACCPQQEALPCAVDADCVEGDDPCAGGRCESGTCVPFRATCAPGTTCCANGSCCPLPEDCISDAD
jgi:hypothetical protein